MGLLSDYYAKNKQQSPFKLNQASPSAKIKQSSSNSASPSGGYLTQYAQKNKLDSLFATPPKKIATGQPVTKQPVSVQKPAEKQSLIDKVGKKYIATFEDVAKKLPEFHFADKENFYTPFGFAAHLAQGTLNTPKEAMRGAVHYKETVQNKTITPQSAAGDIAAMIQLPLLLFGVESLISQGTKLLSGTLTNIASLGLKGTAKLGYATAVEATAKQGIKGIGKIATIEGLAGGAFGLLGGLQSGKEITNANDYVKNLWENVKFGALMGLASAPATAVALPLFKGASHENGAVFVKLKGDKPTFEGLHLDPKAAQSMVIGNRLDKSPAGKAIMKEAIIAEQTGEHVSIMIDKNGKYELPTGQKVTITTEPIYNPAQATKNAIEPGKKSVTAGALTYQESPLITSPEKRAIEKKYGEYLGNNYEQAKAEYQKKFGNVLNTDNARELSPDYMQNPSENAVAVHEPSSAFVAKMYEEELNKPDPKGNNIVTFTGGGSGAGKTTAVDGIPATKAIKDASQIVYDTTLQGFGSADKKVAQALEKGKKVTILYVQRDPVEAFVNGVIPRAVDKGRTVPHEFHVESHINAPQTMLKLIEKYKNDPNFGYKIIDNTKGKGNATVSDIALLRNLKYNKDEITAKILSEIERKYQNGEISESIYKGLKGDVSTTDSGSLRRGSSTEPQPANSTAGTPEKPSDNLKVNDLRPEKQVRRVLNTKETQYLQDVIETKLNHARQVSKSEDEYIKNINELYNDITDKAGNDKVVLSSLRTQLKKEIESIVGKTGNYKADYATFQDMLKQDDEIGHMLNALDDKVKALDEKLLTAKEVMQPKPEAQKAQKTGGNSTGNFETAGTGKLKESRHYKRLVQYLEENDPATYEKVKDDPKLLYNTVNQKYDFENAARIVEENPQKAYNIARGIEKAPEGQRWESVNVVLADRALEEGNIGLWKDLEKNLTYGLTREGQGIVTVKGRFDLNSPHNFVKQVLDTRLARIGKTVTQSIDTSVEQLKSAKAKGLAKIDKAVEKAYTFTKKERAKIDFAQNLLDQLTCK